MRTVAQAVASALAYAKAQTPITPGMCDHYVASYFGLSHSGFLTAYAHAAATPQTRRHGWSIAPPAGALVYWGYGAGHIALSVGRGYIASTDLPRSGRVGIVPIGSVHTLWGKTPLFWSDPWYGAQGQIILPTVTPTPAPTPVLRLANLRPGLRNHDVLIYQSALRRRSGLAKWNPSGATGFYGTETETMTRHAYTDVLHMTGGDLSVPGPALLRWLGYRAA